MKRIEPGLGVLGNQNPVEVIANDLHGQRPQGLDGRKGRRAIEELRVHQRDVGGPGEGLAGEIIAGVVGLRLHHWGGAI